MKPAYKPARSDAEANWFVDLANGRGQAAFAGVSSALAFARLHGGWVFGRAWSATRRGFFVAREA